MLLFPPPLKISETEGFTPENDIFKRRGFGECLARLVERAEDPLVLGLDDPWGEGKTTFVKQWRGLLKSDQFGIDSIYFDAFENDYRNDSFSVIAEELYAFIDNKVDRSDSSGYWDKHKEGFLEGAKKLFAGRGAAFGKVFGSGLGAAVSSTIDSSGPIFDGVTASLTSSFEVAGEEMDKYFKARLKRKAGREGFHQALKIIGKGLREEKKKPLVFIVDELDRCRPDFALDILEGIKHVFSVPGIVFVLVYNGDQMREHIRCRYGRKVKADIYLNKFIDLTTRMPKNMNVRQPHNDDNCKFIGELTDRMGIHFDAEKILAVYAKRKKLSLREIEKVLTMIAISKASLPRSYVDWNVLIVGVCLIRLLNDELFIKILTKVDCWNELIQFFEFDSLTENELDFANMDFFQETWNSLLNPDAPQEEKSRFGRLSYNQEGPVPFFCRALTSFTAANGDAMLFQIEND